MTAFSSLVHSNVHLCPETTKERVEPSTFSIMAIEITHSTGFRLVLLLRIQRYMWRNHVAT